MTDKRQSPWVTNYLPLETQDQNEIVMKLWDYFSLAAAGVCQLYRGKIDRCADFQCLMDALSPMDQFFRGSQRSVEAAVRNGRFVGGQCTRLQLRDLAYASAEAVADENGVKFVVPLQVLLAHELGFRSCVPSNALGKRRRLESRQSSRLKRICRGRCRRSLQRSVCFQNTSTVSAAIVLGANSENDLEQHQRSLLKDVYPPGGRRGRECLRKCLLSCEADRYCASLPHDSFAMFQDAAHMANLLGPLSKFSVTSTSDSSITPPSTPKRQRFDSLTDVHTQDRSEGPSTSA